MKKRKPIHLSNLAMRFYIGDGWTKEELDGYCTRGEVKCFHPEDQFPYYVLDHTKSSAFDADRLAEVVSEIVPCWFWTDREREDFERRTVAQTIMRYNW